MMIASQESVAMGLVTDLGRRWKSRSKRDCVCGRGGGGVLWVLLGFLMVLHGTWE